MPPPENQTANVPEVFEEGFMTLDAAMDSAEGAAVNLSRAGQEDYDNSFVASIEQIYSPLKLLKDPRKADADLPSVKSVSIPVQEQGYFAYKTVQRSSTTPTTPTTANSTVPNGGGVVPTAEDLDPYFFDAYGKKASPIAERGDFVTTANKSDDDPEDPDLTVTKNTNISEIRTVGLRGPLLMSGWGYDIGDKPVPNKGERWLSNPDYDGGSPSSPSNPLMIQNADFSDGDSFKFHDNLGADRSKWKSGPVNLLWDRDRQLWTGGLPMLMGVATSDIDAPPDPTTPTEFTIEVLREAGDEPLFQEESKKCDSNTPCPEGFKCSDVSGYCIQDAEQPVLFMPTQNFVSPLPADPDKPCSATNACPDGYDCTNEKCVPKAESTAESLTLRNFDPSMSQKLVTRNRERTSLDPDWPDQNCGDVSDCEKADLPGESMCGEDGKCLEIPPGAHDWLENPSLVWVLAIKMNYVWIPFYIGCPPECLTADHCVSLYKDDPNFEELDGVDSPANWECNDGECVFSGA
jgi:hypothetical protein